jgi:hypothetical protein
VSAGFRQVFRPGMRNMSGLRDVQEGHCLLVSPIQASIQTPDKAIDKIRTYQIFDAHIFIMGA